MIAQVTLTVTASDEHGAAVGLDVPAIQQLVGAKVKVIPSSASNSTLTFSGPTPVTFGFIVSEIEYDGTRWSLQGTAPNGALAFGTAGNAGPGVADAPVLLGSGCRIRI